MTHEPKPQPHPREVEQARKLYSQAMSLFSKARRKGMQREELTRIYREAFDVVAKERGFKDGKALKSFTARCFTSLPRGPRAKSNGNGKRPVLPEPTPIEDVETFSPLNEEHTATPPDETKLIVAVEFSVIRSLLFKQLLDILRPLRLGQEAKITFATAQACKQARDEIKAVADELSWTAPLGKQRYSVATPTARVLIVRRPILNETQTG